MRSPTYSPLPEKPPELCGVLYALKSGNVGALGDKYTQPGDPWNRAYLLEKREDIMADSEFSDALDDGKALIESSLDGARALLRCDTLRPDPGCNVDTRFILAANRTHSRGFVFAQWVYPTSLPRSPRRWWA